MEAGCDDTQGRGRPGALSEMSVRDPNGRALDLVFPVPVVRPGRRGMRVYYNEFDPFAAAWLRELMTDGLIPKGDVDGRSIADVGAADLAGYDQCHFFAGIGGWAYALSLAGWEGPAWTGSCPCQPFSVAGRGGGESDPRHLWPEFHRLIAECRPPVVFGEQVASRAGRDWLAGVRADLEGVGYGVGAADLSAAGVGAPHIRQRLWWVGERVADALPAGRPQGWTKPRGGPAANSGPTGGVGNSQQPGLEGHAGDGTGGVRHVREVSEPDRPIGPTGNASHWAAAVWHPCRDGKTRRIPAEPALFPLADGLPNRVGLLRGAGNAIVPQVAVAFVQAYLEARA